MRRRLLLGASQDEALAALGPSPDLAALCCALDLHGRLGGDVAASVDAIGEERSRRGRSHIEARAQTSGVRLSARMVAGAPLVFAPMVPSTTSPDATAMAALLVGMGLGCLGFWWIGKLVPEPFEGVDELALLARVAASGIAAGSSPAVLLDALASVPGLGPSEGFAAAKRRVWMGLTWAEALARSEDGGLRALGRAIDTSSRLGVPIEASLRSFAERRVQATRADFEAAVRRAPVKMVLPLTLCVLPAFVLLAIGPLLRGMAVSL